MKPWIPLAALALALSPLTVLHPIRVSGHSMEPALRDGDLRWAVRAWASHRPRRGEVWVVAGPHGPSVKRVLGLPGETLSWDGPDLWIDGRRLEEPWVVHPERNGAGRQACGAGYLVLGDNRPDSQDGRTWGPLPGGSLQGRLLGSGLAGKPDSR
ncbi:signal peptidase I [Geothrix alkalitolerans]|uniref:signal peptidase I n=1 Tax=Geothrix alkalitolerans TaxID=2922724 RepID=UPI001FB03E32